MELTNKELQDLCRAASISEKAAHRLVGSASVPFDTGEGAAPFQLGLRLIGPELRFVGARETVLQSIRSAVREYQSACPQITGWLVRGDFIPTNPPDQIDRGKLVHACRTASRIRAEFIRSLGRSVPGAT